MSKQKNLIEASQNVTFDTSGNVGIGTSSPDRDVHVRTDGTDTNAVLKIEAAGSGNSDADLELLCDDAQSGRIRFYDSSGEGGRIEYRHSVPALVTLIEDTEAMRIDSSGNLLLGKTSADISTSGVQLREGSASGFTRDNTVMDLNRTGSNGQILRFRKDDSTVGIIGAEDDIHIYIGTESGSGLFFGGARIQPWNTDNVTDNTLDFGHPSFRWDDIYATNGTIQTSDQNEKQQIASLTTAEMDAAKAISQLFKTFKWNDSVADKGDAARTHTGVIAQEVETALTNAGLNAGDYAFFTSNTWWEANGETYETLAEAPAGATERTRKGIRYPELLSFVGAATQVQLALQEQRLADIETRLTALEAV